MLAHTVKHLPLFISVYFHDFPFLPVLPFPFFVGLAQPNPIPLCSALSYSGVVWFDVVWCALPRPALSCPALPCLAFPCLALPCPTLPCPTLPCLALPCLALPCLALPCLVPHLFGALSSSTLLSYPHLSSPTLCYAIVLYQYSISSLLSVILKHQRALSATQASTRTQYGHRLHSQHQIVLLVAALLQPLSEKRKKKKRRQ
jgi:hypothetical protein